MADSFNQPGSTGPLDEEHVPIEEEQPLESAPEHPRRAASAEFVVKAQVGSSRILREAMDPANQSLGEALKLSYRVLQFVIVILIALFLVSGFRSVDSHETGVQTRFGKIVTDPDTGDAELTPGLQVSIWPYPISEFIVFDQNGAVDVPHAFWPNAQIGDARSFEERAPSVMASDAMRIGLGLTRDGYLLLGNMEIGHLQFQGEYEIDDAERFAMNIGVGTDVAEVIRLALQQAVVRAGARLTLDQLLGQGDVLAEEIRRGAQELLTQLESGITVNRVQVTSTRPPLAVHTVLGTLGQSREQADIQQTNAHTDAREMLITLAGQHYEELLGLIEQYEELLLASPDAGIIHSPEAQSILSEIDEFLESDLLGGEIKEDIEHARAYEAEIRAKLGAHERRFRGLLAQYRANPEYVIKTQWIETFNKVLAQETAETFRIPPEGGSIRVAIRSDENAMLKRRSLMQRQRSEAAREAAGIGQFQLQMGQGRDKQLFIDEQGRVRGPNEDR
jgi:regulator of protease activity HflC (stomatin/prohibitin superfamily)